MDANKAAAELMKNPQFVEMFQKAMGEGPVPDEKDPGREAWLKQMQEKLAAEQSKDMKQKIEEPVSDAEGQWMWIVPRPGFCIKSRTMQGDKVFINICEHEKIAEPVPLEPEESDDSDTIKFKIPLSCGSLRTDKDKAGKACKVYDVVVNPNTVKRCGEDGEFRRFLAALSMTWIKQKSEPNLNADEFTNINVKCKGKPDLQRIRLSAAPKDANAMNDEIKLPDATGATAPDAKAGGRKMVQEMDAPGEKSSAKAPDATAKPVLEIKPEATASFAVEGQYDWSKHSRAARHPQFREPVPEKFKVDAFLPEVTTIKEVDVRINPRRIDFVYVDSEDGKPFLKLDLPYAVNDEPLAAKFVRKTHLLHLTLAVELPDDTIEQVSKTTASRCAADEEEEERRKAQEETDKQLEEQRARYDRIKKEEEDIMNQRKELVENLNAMSQGMVPPALQSELDAMDKDQLHAMMMRIDGRVKRGDSVDSLMERLPADALEAIVDYIRAKLGLEPKKRPAAPVPKKDTSASEKSATHAAAAEKGVHEEGAAPKEEKVEYNFAKKAENLTGILFNNRYLFALDH